MRNTARAARRHRRQLLGQAPRLQEVTSTGGCVLSPTGSVRRPAARPSPQPIPQREWRGVYDRLVVRARNLEPQSVGLEARRCQLARAPRGGARAQPGARSTASALGRRISQNARRSRAPLHWPLRRCWPHSLPRLFAALGHLRSGAEDQGLVRAGMHRVRQLQLRSLRSFRGRDGEYRVPRPACDLTTDALPVSKLVGMLFIVYRACSNRQAAKPLHARSPCTRASRRARRSSEYTRLRRTGTAGAARRMRQARALSIRTAVRRRAARSRVQRRGQRPPLHAAGGRVLANDALPGRSRAARGPRRSRCEGPGAAPAAPPRLAARDRRPWAAARAAWRSS